MYLVVRCPRSSCPRLWKSPLIVQNAEKLSNGNQVIRYTLRGNVTQKYFFYFLNWYVSATLVKFSNAHSVINVSIWNITLKFICLGIVAICHTNVKCVINHSIRKRIYGYICEYIQESNRTSASFVKRPSVRRVLWSSILVLIQAKCHTNVNCA